MAVEVFKDALVEINSVDLSDHVKSVTLDYGADMQDDTAMGDNTKSNLAGLKNWSLAVEFHQDYAAAEVDATLFSLVGAAAFPIKVRADKAAGVSATNPDFTGNGVLESYPPLGGGVGEIQGPAITIQSAGDLTRATA